MRKLFSLLFLAAALASCTNYGKKVKSGNIEVYYKDGVTEAQAQKTADLFYRAVKEAEGADSGKKSFQLFASGDSINLKMVVDKEKFEKNGSDESLYIIMNMVSDSVFNGKPVNMLLSNNTFKTYRTLAYKKQEDPEKDAGEKFSTGNINVYALNTDAETAQHLADYLNDWLHPQDAIAFQIDKNENGAYSVSMLSTPEKAENMQEASLSETAKRISDNVLTGAPLIFQLKGDDFKTILRTYEYQPEEMKTEAPDSSPVNQ